MSATTHNGSRRDVLLLLDSPDYLAGLNAALAGTGTVVSASDLHRPLGSSDAREYELPEFCRKYMGGRFDHQQIEQPIWWILKRTGRVRTPNFDLISTAAICGELGHPSRRSQGSSRRTGDLRKIVQQRFICR